MQRLFKQYRFNVGKGPLYEGAISLPEEPIEKYPVRLIAYFLPQFHPVKENDAWWGPGFTEWTNVVKSLPHYLGHKQPRLPADLGFYNLSYPDVLRRQAALARRGGIYGFCIHNYWFSGHKLLEKPLNIILENRDIDIRFCLNWANESWSRRWDGSENDILLQQLYEPGDDVRYAESILPALVDPRYIKIDGRPLIMFYRPSAAPDARGTVMAWRKYFKEKGVGDPYVVMAQAFGDFDPRAYGMDAAAGFPPHGGWDLRNDRDRLELLDYTFQGRVVNYDVLVRRMLENKNAEYRLFPGVCPIGITTLENLVAGMDCTARPQRNMGDGCRRQQNRPCPREARTRGSFLLTPGTNGLKGLIWSPISTMGMPILRDQARARPHGWSCAYWPFTACRQITAEYSGETIPLSLALQQSALVFSVVS